MVIHKFYTKCGYVDEINNGKKRIVDNFLVDYILWFKLFVYNYI